MLSEMLLVVPRLEYVKAVDRKIRHIPWEKGEYEK